MERLSPPLLVALLALVGIAAVWDVATRRIPNWLVLAGACAGVGLHVASGGLGGLKTSGLGLLFGFLVFLPVLLLGGKGAGDIKLMAAVGSIAGHANVPALFVLIALCGGVMAVALLLWRGGLMRAVRNVAFIVGQLVRLRSPRARRPELSIEHPRAVTLPYALAIAAGSVVFVLLT